MVKSLAGRCASGHGNIVNPSAIHVSDIASCSNEDDDRALKLRGELM